MHKLVAIGALILCALIPMRLADGLVAERRALRDRVLQEMAQTSAGPQRLEGLAVILPCTETYDEAQGAEKDRKTVRRRTRSCDVHLLAERLRIEGDIEPEVRHRGIYPALVYRARLKLTASFDIPAQRPQADGTRTWGAARIILGLADVRGIRSAPALQWNDTTIPFTAGTGKAPWPRGIQADIPLEPLRGGKANVAFALELTGMERLDLVPAAGDMTVALRAPWPHPSFTGRFPPDTRTVSQNGFEAAWRISSLATNSVPAFQRCAQGKCEDYFAGAFGVSLIQAVDLYQQSYRALRYGLVFVMLTFAIFFLFELLAGLRVHPVQYGLVGIALTLFFVLLLAFAEHVPFRIAYALAAAACVSLITGYVRFVLGSWKRAAGLGGLLSGLYAALLVVLGSEDYALVTGALLIFAALAAFMVLTRHLDWYAVAIRDAPASEAAPSAA